MTVPRPNGDGDPRTHPDPPHSREPVDNQQSGFIFFTGGVISSIGKGLTAASLGSLLKLCGYTVQLKKLDPYLNIDPGTLNPYQHGECFVTSDGAETDLDLGHYERFLGLPTHKSNNLTSGQVYKRVLERERNGDYLGNTVQVIPHITNEIKNFIVSGDEDFIICEIGGTIGDIEGLPFFEAARQIHYDYGSQRVMFIHCTLVPFIRTVGELKTKPTQHSTRELQSAGIQPDMLVCRTEKTLSRQECDKIALFCNIPSERVFSLDDVESIYEAPLLCHDRGMEHEVQRFFRLPPRKPDLATWRQVVSRIKSPQHKLRVAIVGKYASLRDAYMSLNEALTHGGVACDARVEKVWMESDELSSDEIIQERLAPIDGIIVPGGIGVRGTEGMMRVARYARTRGVPYFGICLGMHVALIEFARHVMEMPDAGSAEFGEPADPVVTYMDSWMRDNRVEHRTRNGQPVGGSMRLGSYPCRLREGSLVRSIYDRDEISERHRHRYEVNPDYRTVYEEYGVIFSGSSPQRELIEIMELRQESHPWYVGVQFHPEFNSRPFEPHPLFTSFIDASLKNSRLL